MGFDGKSKGYDQILRKDFCVCSGLESKKLFKFDQKFQQKFKEIRYNWKF